MSTQLVRADAPYEPCGGRFLIINKDFSKQYSNLYVARMKAMKPGLVELAKREWKNVQLAQKIIDTEDNLQEMRDEVALVGVLYKEMGLRSSVLDEFKESGGISLGAGEKLDSLVSEDDVLILEDESGRIMVGGALALQAAQLVTGIVVALRGSVAGDGKFHASDMLTLGQAGSNETTTQFPVTNPTGAVAPNTSSSFVLFVSGLSVGGGNAKTSLALQMLADFLAGRLGSNDDAQLASRVTRVIVCGNSVVSTEALQAGSVSKDAPSWVANSKANAAKLAQENIAPIREFDALLAQALSSVPVDLMPGSDDPSSLTLPQQPLHPCLLPQSSRYSSLSLVTNPNESRVGGLLLLGHSGAPVADIVRQTLLVPSTSGTEMAVEGAGEGEGSKDAAGQHFLQVLHNTLRWGHLAPTGPDSLPFYPFVESDPFVLNPAAMPHVLFAGNAPSFATEMGETLDGHKYRVLAVPSFASTGTVVLLDLANLDVSTLDFGVN